MVHTTYKTAWWYSCVLSSFSESVRRWQVGNGKTFSCDDRNRAPLESKSSPPNCKMSELDRRASVIWFLNRSLPTSLQRNPAPQKGAGSRIAVPGCDPGHLKCQCAERNKISALRDSDGSFLLRAAASLRAGRTSLSRQKKQPSQILQDSDSAFCFVLELFSPQRMPTQPMSWIGWIPSNSINFFWGLHQKKK